MTAPSPAVLPTLPPHTRAALDSPIPPNVSDDLNRNRTKRDFMAEWVAAVNEHGGFGRWAGDVSRSPSDLADVLARHGA
jgi:hypothetical protein